MKLRFAEWLVEEGAWGGQMSGMFGGMAAGIRQGGEDKVKEYAQRIQNGEDAEQVLRGAPPTLRQRVLELVNGGQAGQPQQVSLSDLSDQVSDLNWHGLYDKFASLHQKFPDSPETKQLAQALYQSAQSGDFQSLQPFAQKYLQAQPV